MSGRSRSTRAKGSSWTAPERLHGNRVLLSVLAICISLSGCTGSDDSAARGTTRSTATETLPAPDFSRPPRTYRELMARLPRFDERASPDVATWRKARVSAFFRRCTSAGGGAGETAFVTANRRVLGEITAFPGATFLDESSIPRSDGNGCPEGHGPATYYLTYRSYRLPERTRSEAVLGHYQHEFYGWVAASSTAPCERTFSQGPAYVVVRACGGMLRLSVRARAPVQPTAAASSPPRPLGLQYPAVVNHLATPRPTAFSSEPGETCERIRGSTVPSIIIPPTPGVRATVRGPHLVVGWMLGTVHGDCPPSELVLRSSGSTARTIRVPVHTAAGTTRMPLVGGQPPTSLTAIAISVDGVESRPVSVLVRT